MESTLKRQVLKYLATRPGRALKIAGGPMQRAGEPDILYVETGHAYFFELKTAPPGTLAGEPTAIQRHCMDQWAAAGATVAVVRSIQDVRAVFRGVEGG